jgi:hypothetical protein
VALDGITARENAPSLCTPLAYHGGGLRKVRWAAEGTGKRGGVRITFYWDSEKETFFMLYAYGKTEQENLTPAQLRTLAALVRKELK